VNDLLVTGTDTGVGKTVVAAGLILALREHGRAPVGWKPAESGGGPPEDLDSAILAWATGRLVEGAEPLLQLEEPLAPAVAAARAGRAFDPAEALARIARLRKEGTLVVEGAGGLLVPLAFSCTALDLARDAGLAAVIVARAGLGTLNHTLLTVRALASEGVPLRGVVLNGARGQDLAEQTNPEVLAGLLPGATIVSFPHQGGASAREIARRLAPLLGPLVR
jgi:dethiobiotin synthetase